MQAFSWHAEVFSRLAAAKDSLPHALLLHGPRGTGKLIFARALAQALLCENPGPAALACERCSACVWFEGGTHPDYRQVEPATTEGEDGEQGEKKASIAVDQIRILPDFVNVSSHRGGAKVIVVHPAEALNVNAANALLKSLEEPPPRTYFVLVANRPHQLLPTIKSRCQQVSLPAPDSAAAAAWLAGQGVQEPALALAHMGDAPLLALELEKTEYWGARAAFLRQLTAREIDVLAAGEAVRDIPIPHVVAWLQKWSYDIVHYATLGRVRYNPDQHEAIARGAAAAEPLAALRFHRDMVKLQPDVNHPLNARLFIEHVLLAYRDLVE